MSHTGFVARKMAVASQRNADDCTNRSLVAGFEKASVNTEFSGDLEMHVLFFSKQENQRNARKVTTQPLHNMVETHGDRVSADDQRRQDTTTQDGKLLKGFDFLDGAVPPFRQHCC